MTLLLEPDHEAAETLRIALPGDVQVVDSIPGGAPRAHHLRRGARRRRARRRPGPVARARGAAAARARRGGRGAAAPPARRLRCSARRCGPASARWSARRTSPRSRTRACARWTSAAARAAAPPPGPQAHGDRGVQPPRAAAARPRWRPTSPSPWPRAGGTRSASSTSTWPSATCAIALQLMPARTIVDAVAMSGHLDDQRASRASRPRTRTASTRSARRWSLVRPNASRCRP